MGWGAELGGHGPFIHPLQGQMVLRKCSTGKGVAVQNKKVFALVAGYLETKTSSSND